MRTAIFSDVHSNLEGLEAVRQAGFDRGVERWICLGDVVGYGADPEVCLDIVVDLAAVILQGNHDAAVAGVQDVEYFNRHARRAVEWTRQTLCAERLGPLLGFRLTHSEAEAFFVHSEPGDPRAYFALRDEESDSIELVRVAYDVTAAGQKILDAGLPRFLAERLAQGC